MSDATGDTPRPSRRDRLAERERLFDAGADFAPLIGVETRDGVRYLVSTGDAAVGKRLFVRRSRGEMRLLRVALSILERTGHRDPSRRTFLDIGANIGTTTLTALHLDYGFDAALAAEPEPENFRLLRANLALNNLEDRVTALQVAASDVAGHIGLRLDSKNSGNHRVVKLEGKKSGVAKVPAVRLDDLVAEGLIDPAAIGMLWIDVQGHEGHVLRGATKLVEQGPPAVVEYSAGRMATAGGLAAFETIVREHFDEVYDLRNVDDPHPLSSVDVLFENRDTRESTDLLLIPKRSRR